MPTLRNRHLALATLASILMIASPAYADSSSDQHEQGSTDQSQPQEEDEKWRRGDPVQLSDRINLRDNMTLFRFGLGIRVNPQIDELGPTGHIDYRTAISDTVDYRFPLVFSVRFLEREAVTMAIEGGIVGVGVSSDLGFLLHGYARLPAQYRLSDKLGVTVEVQGAAFTSWGRVAASYSAGGATILEWTNGDRLQGGVGAEFEWDQDRIVNTSAAIGLRTASANFLTARIGSVGGPDVSSPRPLLQVRIHKGFHLYEASSASFDARSLALIAHRHVLGFKWYY